MPRVGLLPPTRDYHTDTRLPQLGQTSSFPFEVRSRPMGAPQPGQLTKNISSYLFAIDVLNGFAPNLHLPCVVVGAEFREI